MKRAVELGHTTYFTTEHGFQGNLFETQTLCEKYGLKPIYGVEAYYVDDISDRTDRTAYHLMLIGMTERARYEINKILSVANTSGFYYKPRIGLKELLSLTPSDTIVTTACIAGRLFKPKSCVVTDEIIGWEEVEELFDDHDLGAGTHKVNKPVYKKEIIGPDSWYTDFVVPVKEHFGKNFYLEVQSHNVPSQIEYNKKILKLAEKENIEIIHACDSHYIHTLDAPMRDLFLRAKGINYSDESNFVLDYPSDEQILRRYEAQGVLSPEQAKRALENTLIFDNAEAVYTDKEFKIPLVPNSFIQEELGPGFTNEDNDAVLREIIGRSFREKLKSGKISVKRKDEYAKAILDEVETVKKCGMASYFVLDHIIVKRAVEKYGAVLTRSGRGSAVSFIINNFLGLTEVDRIKAPVKLYPSRFMSAERILNSRSLPDIDLNFADVKPVIKASKDVLGEDGIYYMVAYKPLQRSSAFRLYCKAIGKPIESYDEIAKNLSDKTYTDEMFCEEHPDWAEIFEESKGWRGVIESIAPSPCSFELSNKNISEQVGLIRVGNEICCALDGYNCDVYKFLKND